jgi:hypothetical protein
MKQLESKDIYGYLPYGLKFEVFQNSNYIGIEETRGVYLRKSEKSLTIWCDGIGYNSNHFQFKPILRPLSGLYKTITHNREKIIPIVKLAKMEYDCEWKIRKIDGFMFAIYDFWKFHYSEFERAFRFKKYNRDLLVINQHQLFDYLYELKIDYRGLIESGLAIDANTLETNPYK